MDDDYVGFGHPPKEHQFKKGQSGNPAGRPKKLHLYERLKAIGEELVTVVIDGKRQRVPAQEAMLRSAAAKALQGNIRDIRQYVMLCKDIGLPMPQVDFETMEKRGNIVKEFREKLLREAAILEKELAPLQAYWDDRAQMLRSIPGFEEKLSALGKKHLDQCDDPEVLDDLTFQIKQEEGKLYNT